MADYLNIAGRVRTTASDGVAMEAQEVKDLNLNKSQQEVNADVQMELGDRYTKEETYNREEIEELVDPTNYVSVVATNLTTDVTDLLPAEGATDTIYRVGNWNGTQYDPTMYALFAWNGSAYVCLAVRSFVGEVYDISVNHPDGLGNPTPYADLAAALGTGGTNIPADIRCGGMRIQFIKGTVQSNDNKYVQYRYMGTSTANADFTNVANWQGVDGDITLFDKNGNISQGHYYVTFNNVINVTSKVQGYFVVTGISKGNFVIYNSGWSRLLTVDFIGGEKVFIDIPATGVSLGVFNKDSVVVSEDTPIRVKLVSSDIVQLTEYLKTYSVRSNPQQITEEGKQQARQNIGLGDIIPRVETLEDSTEYIVSVYNLLYIDRENKIFKGELNEDIIYRNKVLEEKSNLEYDNNLYSVYSYLVVDRSNKIIEHQVNGNIILRSPDDSFNYNLLTKYINAIYTGVQNSYMQNRTSYDIPVENVVRMICDVNNNIVEFKNY